MKNKQTNKISSSRGSCLMREKLKIPLFEEIPKASCPYPKHKAKQDWNSILEKPPQKCQSELNHDQLKWQFLLVWQDQQHQSSPLKRSQPKVSEGCAYIFNIQLVYKVVFLWFSLYNNSALSLLFYKENMPTHTQMVSLKKFLCSFGSNGKINLTEHDKKRSS